MKDFNNLPTSMVAGKNSNKLQSKGKSFGYQVLGFGSGGAAGPTEVDYLIVAGGGGSANDLGGGAGAGGARHSYGIPGQAPIAAIPPGTYPVVIGGGGTAACSGADTNTPGVNSVFYCITATGGGAGGYQNGPGRSACNQGYPGGSGGGGTGNGPYPAGAPGGAGNTPPFSPVQGFNGGLGAFTSGNMSGGGGGGAGEVGADGTDAGSGNGGRGGVGITSCITGSPVSYAGGGGGNGEDIAGGASPCGTGGAGATGPGAGTAGATNKGGGAGGGAYGVGAAGGPGVVVTRFPGLSTVTVTPCTNTVSTLPAGAGKVAKFTVSGILTVS